MFSASAHRVFGPRHWAGAKGFTLIELLLVMFILTVLVALGVGVASYVIDQARITETVAAQQTLISAIEAYKRATGSYPAYDPNSDGTDLSVYTVVQTLKGDRAANDEQRKEIQEATMASIQVGGFDTDGFGTPMRYYARRGLGGKPLVVSAGPDGKFGDEDDQTDESKKRDNIRSDTYTTDGRRKD